MYRLFRQKLIHFKQRRIQTRCSMGVIWGRQKVFTCLIPQIFYDIIVGYNLKVVNFCWPSKWLFLMVELRVLSGNHCSLKAPCIINSQNFWNG